jgi:hypothetical protein
LDNAPKAVSGKEDRVFFIFRRIGEKDPFPTDLFHADPAPIDGQRLLVVLIRNLHRFENGSYQKELLVFFDLFFRQLVDERQDEYEYKGDQDGEPDQIGLVIFVF